MSAAPAFRFFRTTALALALVASLPAVADPAEDQTAAALSRCLALAANASTAGQVECEATALRNYDRRMNLAYAALLRRLPAAAAARLRQTQRAWIAYRDAETASRAALYATRQGTMYVPMAADAAATVVGDRARLLERHLRILGIE